MYLFARNIDFASLCDFSVGCALTVWYFCVFRSIANYCFFFLRDCNHIGDANGERTRLESRVRQIKSPGRVKQKHYHIGICCFSTMYAALSNNTKTCRHQASGQCDGMEGHVYQRTLVSVNYHYSNATTRVGLVQSEPTCFHHDMTEQLLRLY